MRSAISSFRSVMMSPTRRSTSPRAGAGVRFHRSKPRLAEVTARSTSSRPERGKRPMTSVVSAGFVLSKYSSVDGVTHSPATKFLNVFMRDVGGSGRNAGSAAGPGGGTIERRRGIADARENLHRAEHEAPHDQDQRYGVRPSRAMAPAPDR